MFKIGFVDIGRPRKLVSILKPMTQLKGFNIEDSTAEILRFFLQNSTRIKLASPSKSDDASVTKGTLYREIRLMKTAARIQNEAETQILDQVVMEEMTLMKQMEDEVVAVDQAFADDMKFMLHTDDAAAEESEKFRRKANSHALKPVADVIDDAALLSAIETVIFPGTPGAVNRQGTIAMSTTFNDEWDAVFPNAVKSKTKGDSKGKAPGRLQKSYSFTRLRQSGASADPYNNRMRTEFYGLGRNQNKQTLPQTSTSFYDDDDDIVGWAESPGRVVNGFYRAR